MSSNQCIYILWGGDHYTEYWGIDVWLQAKIRERRLVLWPRLNAGPVRNAQRRSGGICGLRHNLSVESFLHV